MMETEVFSFSPLDHSTFESLSSREHKEALFQWNLDSILKTFSFRFTGTFVSTSMDDYRKLLVEFFSNQHVLDFLGLSGVPIKPMEMNMKILSLNVTNMNFFDKFSEHGLVLPSGDIRGTFDDIFDGISVGDVVRESLINPDSENSFVFSDEDKNELIYQLFKVFAVGGSMCQPDTKINRYLDVTKAFYKELVTIYKDSKTGDPKLSGQAFMITSINGLQIFPTDDNSNNVLIVLVDPLKKIIRVIYKPFVSYW